MSFFIYTFSANYDLVFVIFVHNNHKGFIFTQTEVMRSY